MKQSTKAMEMNRRGVHSFFIELMNRISTRTLVQIFFPLLIFSILFSFHYESCLAIFIQFHSVKHHVNKKAVFCFFNAILIFLAKDSGLFISCKQELEIRNPLPAEPSAQRKCERQFSSATQAAEPAKVEILRTSEVTVVEEAAAGDEDEVAGKMEEFRGEHSGLFISCYRELEIRHPLLAEPSAEPKPKPGRQLSLATQEAVPAKVEILRTLEVALVEEATVGNKAEIVEQMEELGIDELNRKFDEFIDDVKRKRKMEELQLVMI